MKFKKTTLLSSALLLAATHAISDTTVDMHLVNENGTSDHIGKVMVKEHDKGVVFTPKLTGLTSGLHGFHVHEFGSCAPKKKDGKVTPAGAAGGHLNLHNAKHHGAPWADGHTGDLPALFVDANSVAEHPVLAPGLKMKHIKGKALMIHQGGDNYSDSPKPLGGGGARVACGII